MSPFVTQPGAATDPKLASALPDDSPTAERPTEVNGRARALIWRVLLFIPVLASAWLVFSRGVDVPFWDEWALADLLQAITHRTLTFGDLFKQHNEHRMLVPRVLQIAVASVAGWNTRTLMWLSQGLLVLGLVVCVALARRSFGRPSWRAEVALVLVSLFLFSPAQHQNLLWGYQICFFLPILCVLGMVWFTLSPASSALVAVSSAILFPTAASFSVFAGLLTWPLAAAALLARSWSGPRISVGQWTIWGLGCAVALAAYFVPYVPPSSTPSIVEALRHPTRLLAAVGICAGAPFSIATVPVRSAFLAGIATIAAFSCLLVPLWLGRADRSLLVRAAPWVIVGGFGLLSAAATALGRVGFGYPALLESRYASFTLPMTLATVMVAAILREHAPSKSTSRLWPIACVLAILLYGVGVPKHLSDIESAYVDRLQSRAVYQLARYADSGWPMIPRWMDWPARRQQLLELEASGWRRPSPSAPAWLEDSVCTAGTVEFVTVAGTRTMAGGWSYLPSTGRPADAVVMTVGPSRRIAAVQQPVIGRADIGERFETDRALVSGWVIETKAAAGESRLEFWGLDAAAYRAFKLCPGGR